MKTALPLIAKIIPNMSACLGDIQPFGIGLVLVRDIPGSMSLSYTMLMALEPPAAMVPPTSVTMQDSRVSSQVLSPGIDSLLTIKSCAMMAQRAVI